MKCSIELAPSLPVGGTLESSVRPVSCLVSTVELDLVTGVWLSQPEFMSRGEMTPRSKKGLALPFVCHEVSWVLG